jgi:hypothetical protein
MQILVSMQCKPRFYFLPGPWLQYLLSILHSFCSPIRRLLASTCLGPEHRSIMLPVFSGKDNLLPSGEEADRLFKALKNCRVRYFKDNGHTLLLVQSSPVIPISLSDYTYMYVCKRQCISSAIIFCACAGGWRQPVICHKRSEHVSAWKAKGFCNRLSPAYSK